MAMTVRSDETAECGKHSCVEQEALTHVDSAALADSKEALSGSGQSTYYLYSADVECYSLPSHLNFNVLIMATRTFRNHFKDAINNSI